MALARDDSIQHPDFRSAGEQRESPGPLHVSDLTSPRRPHKLEPLQQQQGGSGEGGGGGATKTKRKKTRIKRQGAVGELRGDLDGREEASEDPLLDASTLQQMQARLDPLYNPPTNVEPQKTTTFSSGSESAPIRTVVEDEMSGERGRRGREEGEGRGETGSRKRRRKRRTRRESGSESNDREPGPSDEQERPGTPLAATTSHSPTPPSQTEGSSRVAATVPHYFPPRDEIQDEEGCAEGGKGGRERVVEGASPVTVSHHLSQSPGLVFVERADGRGFDVRHKSSSVAPASDDTQCLKLMDRPISSELAALYSHQLVQRISVTAHGLLAGNCSSLSCRVMYCVICLRQSIRKLNLQ
ncbi:hypothetical protein GBAR_LOCUS24181 [Geodia barretti]|uniref:Uncharacterized protein n=1 Tax=Geodia barretti TaxID=519541 RepID=A0AA35T899_GEOBA|nr:hypothetical protein GBAR_LOCUS24181 [Geodia barretti]